MMSLKAVLLVNSTETSPSHLLILPYLLIVLSVDGISVIFAENRYSRYIFVDSSLFCTVVCNITG